MLRVLLLVVSMRVSVSIASTFYGLNRSSCQRVPCFRLKPCTPFSVPSIMSLNLHNVSRKILPYLPPSAYLLPFTPYGILDGCQTLHTSAHLVRILLLRVDSDRYNVHYDNVVQYFVVKSCGAIFIFCRPFERSVQKVDQEKPVGPGVRGCWWLLFDPLIVTAGTGASSF